MKALVIICVAVVVHLGVVFVCCRICAVVVFVRCCICERLAYHVEVYPSLELLVRSI
jgi:hypothetical protein